MCPFDFQKYLKLKHYHLFLHNQIRITCLGSKESLVLVVNIKSRVKKAITVTIISLTKRECVRESEKQHSEHIVLVHSKRIGYIEYIYFVTNLAISSCFS